jgi:membrane protein
MAATATAWGLGGLSVKELGKRVWSEMQEDEVFGRSAQLSYYFLLALFPLLLFLTALIGYFAGADSELRTNLFEYLRVVLPGEASELIQTTVSDVTQGSGGGKLSFGILAALWAASNGMGAISESLNVAYDVKETRPWWRARLNAVILTVALAFLIISALVLILYGHDIAENLAARLGLGTAFEWTWKILQWPLVLAFVLLAFALIYYLAPDLHDQAWKWVTPGSIIGVLLWLAVSFVFKLYLTFFNSYSATYGSLGAVIILMLWFYFTGAAILIGGEINSEIEHEMALQGEPDAKEKGEKSPDEKEAAGGVKPEARDGGRARGKGDQQDRSQDAPRRDKQTATGGDTSRPRARTHSSPATQATRVDRNAPPAITRTDAGRSRLGLGKVALVFGAWALSKLRGGGGGGSRKNS